MGKLYLLLFIGFNSFVFATNPNPPVINEPPSNILVNPADVHMEITYSDPDGDPHFCTDWEIWTDTSAIPDEVAWHSLCAQNFEKIHIHLGNGSYINSHSALTSLLPDYPYEIRVRVSDATGWSGITIKKFRTGPSSVKFPLFLDDIVPSPTPQWKNINDSPIILTPGNPKPSLKLGTFDGDIFLEIRSNNGSTNEYINPASIGAHKPLRVNIYGGSNGVVLPSTYVTFTDQSGKDHKIYLPSVTVTAMSNAYYWISSDGSSYFATALQSTPDFSLLAQGNPIPWTSFQAGYRIEKVADGLKLPINIAFVPNPTSNPIDPFFYVTELHGKIKVMQNNGTVRTYADNLLNFDPGAEFPGTGEQGVTGIVVAPGGDVIAAVPYKSGSNIFPRIVRFSSTDGGLTASSQTILLDMIGSTMSSSHIVGDLSISPDPADGKLYVHIGDGYNPANAPLLTNYLGKVLRMNLNGTAPSDNPWYNGAPIEPRDYIYATGFRNPFGGGWRIQGSSYSLYATDVGPIANDRIGKVWGGQFHNWDGDYADLYQYAIFNYEPSPHAPTDILWLYPSIFNGSGFPSDKMGSCFVAESGPTYAIGQQSQGKKIVEFVNVPENNLYDFDPPIQNAVRKKFVEYTGSGRATVIGLTAGPDGIYFTDLYKDQDNTPAILNDDVANAPGANIFRIKFVGIADFTSNYRRGLAPFPVQFTDDSNVPGANSWLWDFGDGTFSTQQNPSHIYQVDGPYNIRLTVTGTNGDASIQKNGYIIVGEQPIGLIGSYYDDLFFSEKKFERIDPTVNFDWSNTTGNPQPPPDPSIEPDHFSVIWEGRIQPPTTNIYTFSNYLGEIDDGIRVTIISGVDTQVVLSVGTWPPVDDSSPGFEKISKVNGDIGLVTGIKYPIKIEYYQKGLTAIARLRWNTPGQTPAIVPTSSLYPPAPQLLPIELSSFKGSTIEGKEILLEWITATEINSYGFSIERRMDLNEIWDEVGFIHANGNSNTPIQYSYRDNSVEQTGKYFYRLKMIDLDGQYEYSPVTEVSLGSPITYSLGQNYPNPFNPQTTIEFSLPKDEFLSIKVFDILGSEVITLLNEKKKAGNYKINFDAGILSSGVYFYRMNAGKYTETKKFTILK
jgi:PKD repeat protein/glucose/arabinose dehydrogenase